MHPDDDADVTQILAAVANDDEDAKALLVKVVYEELHRMAASLMRRERTDHTLNSTALVNEAILRLVNPQQLAAIANRRMLFAAAARAMRQVLIDSARKKVHQRKLNRQPLQDAAAAAESMELNPDELQTAMINLESAHPRAFQAVDLKFFAGLKVAEIATLLEVSHPTVERDLATAKKFLRRRLLA